MTGLRATSPSGGPRHAPTGGQGPSGTDAEPREDNAWLTAVTAVVLFVLLTAEGVTVLRINGLLTAHVVIGMVLVPAVLVEPGNALWRFARYCMADPRYRRKGPHQGDSGFKYGAPRGGPSTARVLETGGSP